MRFSEKKEHQSFLENEDLSIESRNKIWKVINRYLLTILGLYEYQGKNEKYFTIMEKFYRYLWIKFFSERINQIESLSKGKNFNVKKANQFFQENLHNCSWFIVFDIIETIDSYNRRFIRIEFDFSKYINDVFLEENIDFYYQNHQIKKKS